MRSLTAIAMACLSVVFTFGSHWVQATDYFISSSMGSDGNDGLSESSPFESLTVVSALDLTPGDRVRLRCGDTWSAQQLEINVAGIDGNPILFGSYPSDCADRPVLSGVLPIAGWTSSSGAVFVADLSAGANAGLFPLGITQLFRDDARLPCGRWPNLDDGYAFVDAAPAADQLTDAALPAADWSDAIVRIKTQRWLLVNREVTSSSGSTLNLNDTLDCRGGTCAGWGYFLQNHVAALDEDGEWSYDAATNRVYLFSASGIPTGVTGSVVLDDDPGHHGGVMVRAGAEYVVVENLKINRWWANGVGAQGSMSGDAYHHVTIRNCEISEVDAAGVRFSTWVWSADSGPDGFRCRNMSLIGNRIIGANHFGITGYCSESLIEDNDISGIGLIGNLNITGMGCGTTGASCTEYGDGIRIRTHDEAHSGHHNTVRFNRFSRTGSNAVDVFGPYATIEYNHIVEPCFSKGDCGGVRVFGGDNLTTTVVHDVWLRWNIIEDSVGNVDGVKIDYRQPFGMGLYIDHHARDVETAHNTVLNSTFTGLLYQNSTGVATGNTLHNNATGVYYTGQINLVGEPTQLESLTDNILYGRAENAWTLVLDGGSLLHSDDNYFFHPVVPEQITIDGWQGRMTFPEWQVWSGQDEHSLDSWFTLAPGEQPVSKVFTNPTTEVATVDLRPRKYLDLDQNPVSGTLILQPFASRVLIDDGLSDEIFQDGFESGDPLQWSS